MGSRTQAEDAPALSLKIRVFHVAISSNDARQLLLELLAVFL
jgi:hypothetical protein